MDLFEAHNIQFLNLEDVDDVEREELLATLHSENSSVQLPWKVLPIKDVAKTDTSFQQSSVTHDENKEKVVPPQHHYPVFVSNQMEYSPYLSQPSHYNPPTIYPSAITYPITQPQYIVYSPIPTTYPTYPLAAPIVSTNIPDNINYSNSIHNPAIIETPHVNEEYAVEATDDNQFSNVETYQGESHTSPILEIIPFEHEPLAQKDELTPPEKSDNEACSIHIVNPSETQHNGVAQPPLKKQATNKSWASLFSSATKSTDSVNNGGDASEVKQTASSVAVNEPIFDNNHNNKENEKICHIRNPRKAQFVDPNCYLMGEFLLNHQLDGRTISLQPRGLINRSNYCYINSILQALLACPPLYNLMTGLVGLNTMGKKAKATPIIDGMCRFIKEFQHLPPALRVNRRNEKNHKKDQGITIDGSISFEPTWIYKMLNGVRSDSFLIEGRQEDAEEFLGCLLNGLNDEMIELMKLVKNDISSNDVINKPSEQESDKEWQVMGPKNKGSVTRKTNFIKTPISDIFGGSLKSRIHRTGDQSTYNIQPFFTLQLNIEKVQTVREALEALASKNQLEGLTSEKTKEEVEAWQQVTLEELPIILVLHLKCFDFKLDGCTKIVKALEFPIDLKIDAKLLSSKPANVKERQYKLFAVVYHDGKEATKGHYVTDAFHVGYSSWIRYDDCSLKPVQEELVLKPQGTRVPYLLFYRRSDTIRSK